MVLFFMYVLMYVLCTPDNMLFRVPWHLKERNQCVELFDFIHYTIKERKSTSFLQLSLLNTTTNLIKVNLLSGDQRLLQISSNLNRLDSIA